MIYDTILEQVYNIIGIIPSFLNKIEYGDFILLGIGILIGFLLMRWEKFYKWNIGAIIIGIIIFLLLKISGGLT